MRVVVAPDSFKGSATALEVASSIAEGWRSVRPDDEVRLAPMADGGEGTLDALAAAVTGARRMPVEVSGPDGRRVTTSWLLLPDGTGVVELASTSGLTLLDRVDPMSAHTLGVGEAVAAALDAGVRRLLLAVGGSASTDGGIGALTALGARFHDAAGRPVPLGGRGLELLVRVDLVGLRPPPVDGVVVLSDVTNPLTGPAGAAAVFGEQKGAGPAEREALDAGLARWAAVAGVDPATPGAGAAGGTAYGALLWGASIESGAETVAEAIGLERLVATADLVITGEGRYDAQTASGKAPAVVARHAASVGVPIALVAGSIEAVPAGFTAARSLVVLAGGLAAALEDPRRWLHAAGASLAETSVS